MGLYLSGEEVVAVEGRERSGPRRGRESSQREVQRATANLPDEIKPAREKEIGIETKITDPTFPVEFLFLPSFPFVPRPRAPPTSGFMSEAM